MSSTRNVQIDGAKPPRGQMAGVLGMVSFSWTPTDTDDPIKVTRYSKTANNGQGGEFDCARIVGARRVSVQDALIREGKKGPWIATNNMQGVPSDVLREVCDGACRVLGIGQDSLEPPKSTQGNGGKLTPIK